MDVWVKTLLSVYKAPERQDSPATQYARMSFSPFVVGCLSPGHPVFPSPLPQNLLWEKTLNIFSLLNFSTPHCINLISNNSSISWAVYRCKPSNHNKLYNQSEPWYKKIFMLLKIYMALWVFLTERGLRLHIYRGDGVWIQWLRPP